MSTKEQGLYSAANQPQSTNENSTMLLSPTKMRIPSITSGVDIYTSQNFDPYYVKPLDPAKNEFMQLLYLSAAGLPTPKEILICSQTNTMATSYAGRMFDLTDRFYNAGAFLNYVHSVLDSTPPLDVILQCTYQHTAHTVDNFFYKHMNMVTDKMYRNYKLKGIGMSNLQSRQSRIENLPAFHSPYIPIPSDAHHSFQDLISEANMVAKQMLEKLITEVVFLNTEESHNTALPFLALKKEQICYGDFKPDNILVDPYDNQKLVLIDPFITNGSKQFDLAKFTSRVRLANEGSSNELLDSFYQGYGTGAMKDTEGYGAFGFNDLVKIDSLNILKSYVKRYVRGDLSYHAVRQLAEPTFCKRLKSIFE